MLVSFDIRPLSGNARVTQPKGLDLGRPGIDRIIPISRRLRSVSIDERDRSTLHGTPWSDLP
jgi:hypothetical protein